MPYSAPTAVLDAAAAALAHGRVPDALRLIQTRYPTPRGWVPAIERNAPREWGRGERRIVTQRNGVLYAGSRDWFTKTGTGLHSADQVNANPAGGQYILRQTAAHTALVAPRPRRQLPEGAPYLIGSATNYYHWLLDYLPRVPLALAADPRARLVVGADMTSFESDSLAGFGIGPDQLVTLGRH
ncbi:MAG: glycosyltransferase family 61 protein [Magnetospirillum sp.]|nr:glycosyltransferase family 61 protein [Magnetospirillum sp.]